MPASPDRFEWFVNPDLGEAPLVFVGLGPEPASVAKWFDLPSEGTFYYVESQEFIDQMGPEWEKSIPLNFSRLTPNQFNSEIVKISHVARYLPVQGALPTFYAPLTARLILSRDEYTAKPRTVWLPSTNKDLLGKELASAFKDNGYAVRFIDHEAVGKHPGAVLPELLADGVPDLYFSINFKGIDHFGLAFHILQEAGVEVAVWMVDNPFNLLPSVKSRYWQQAKLFVTDHTFIGPLTETGAKWIKHLPLAASPKHFAETGRLPAHAHDIADKTIFVGRSEFPAKDKFFAGARLPAQAVTRYQKDTSNTRFDYHWWRDQMRDIPLWPGNDSRNIGAGAELSGKHWKLRSLAAAGEIAIFGDDGWAQLENADLRPQVDYYAHLPAVYREAALTLNVTGMQLPAGLTQRHFDVWCAGGFLITDDNPGLKIFPDELTQPITYKHPDDIRTLREQYESASEEKTQLQEAWRALIVSEHTYSNRIKTILTSLQL